MEGENALALKDITIEGDVVVEHLMDFKIERQINTHTKLQLVAIIKEELKDVLVEEMQAHATVSVLYREESVFSGSITRIECRMFEGTCYCTVEALSGSWMLDQKREKRSFRKKVDTYRKILREIGKNYTKYDFIGADEIEQELESYLVQYEETDFEFIKRVAARVGLPIVVEDTKNVPRFYVGLPEGVKPVELEEAHFIGKSLFDEFLNAHVVGLSQHENDFRGCEIESKERVPLGGQVKYQNRSLVVTKIKTTLEKGLLLHRYTLMPKRSTIQSRYCNPTIKGVSLSGTVVEVEGTRVKVNLQIDSKEVTNWYTYGSYTTNVMYCMPYVGDTIKVHFPTQEEAKALAIRSVYQGERLHPDTKFWSNRQGKRVEFTPASLTFQAKKNVEKEEELFIKWTHEQGMEIKSDHRIAVECTGKLSLQAKTICMSAPEEVTFYTHKNARESPPSILSKGVFITPTEVHFEVQKNVIIEGTDKQSYPVEEEPRPELLEKSQPAKEEKKEKKKKNWFGLGLAVLGVAAAVVTLGVFVGVLTTVAAPLLLAGGVVKAALAIGVLVGASIGCSQAMEGAEVIWDAGKQMIQEGKKYSEVSDQFWQGMTFVAGGISTMYLSMAIGGELTHMASFVDFRIGILSTKVFANSMPALGGTWFGLRGYTPTSKPVVSGKELVNNRYIQIGYANTNFGDKAVYIGSPLLAQKGPQVVQNVMSNLPMLGQHTTTTVLAQIPQVASTALPTILTPSMNTPLISMVGNNLQASSTGIGNQVGTLVQNSNPNAGVLTEGRANTKYAVGYDSHLINGTLGKGSKGVVGGHNLNEFKKALTDAGFNVDDCILSMKKHPKIEGIYEIEYRIPAKQYSQSGALEVIPNQYKTIKYPKTVYDPSVITDSQILEWGKEAMEAGTIQGRNIFGYSSNGIRFEGYVDKDTGEITNFYPVVE